MHAIGLSRAKTTGAKVFESPKINPLWVIHLENRHSNNPAVSTDYGSEPVVTLLEINIFAESKEAAMEKLPDVLGQDWPDSWAIYQVQKY